MRARTVLLSRRIGAMNKLTIAINADRPGRQTVNPADQPFCCLITQNRATTLLRRNVAG